MTMPTAFPIMMFIGSMILVLWRKLNPLQCTALVFAVASGLIAGESVMDVVTAAISPVQQMTG